MTQIERIGVVVNEYNASPDKWDAEQLQLFKDNLSYHFFLAADEFSTIRIKSEALAYEYKKAKAQEEDDLRESGIKLTRDAIRVKVELTCEDELKASQFANKNYYRARQIQEAVPHIINSINSRLKMVKV